MSTAAIVVVGNEILDGSANDTNSGWMCRQISGRGASTLQITTVPDVKARIELALDQTFALRPRLILTLGGLGPTRDDLTISAIAGYADLPTEVHTGALAIVERRYQELAEEGRIAAPNSEETRRAREKMARFPVGGEAIYNDVGAAPALHLEVRDTGILALPGVPAEVKSIVLNHATHVFSRWLGTGAFGSISITTSTNDESALDAALREFDSKSSFDVYLKSRARRFGGDVRMLVTLSAKGSDRGDIEKRLIASLEAFTTALHNHGIQISETTRDI